MGAQRVGPNWVTSLSLSVAKNMPATAGNIRDMGSIPGSARSPGEGNGNLLQYCCLENPHGQRSLMGFKPQGHKRVRHKWVTNIHMRSHRKRALLFFTQMELGCVSETCFSSFSIMSLRSSHDNTVHSFQSGTLLHHMSLPFLFWRLFGFSSLLQFTSGYPRGGHRWCSRGCLALSVSFNFLQ